MRPTATKDDERVRAILSGSARGSTGATRVTYSVACMEALLGKKDDALAHLT